MAAINTQGAKIRFSKIMRRVKRGDAILNARDGVVIARIILTPQTARINLNCDAGKSIIADDFDAPLAMFAEYGKMKIPLDTPTFL